MWRPVGEKNVGVGQGGIELCLLVLRTLPWRTPACHHSRFASAPLLWFHAQPPNSGVHCGYTRLGPRLKPEGDGTYTHRTAVQRPFAAVHFKLNPLVHHVLLHFVCPCLPCSHQLLNCRNICNLVAVILMQLSASSSIPVLPLAQSKVVVASDDELEAVGEGADTNARGEGCGSACSLPRVTHSSQASCASKERVVPMSVRSPECSRTSWQGGV